MSVTASSVTSLGAFSVSGSPKKTSSHVKTNADCQSLPKDEKWPKGALQLTSIYHESPLGGPPVPGLAKNTSHDGREQRTAQRPQIEDAHRSSSFPGFPNVRNCSGSHRL